MKALSNMRNIEAKNVVSVGDLDRAFNENIEKGKDSIKPISINKAENVEVYNPNDLKEVTKQVTLFQYVKYGREKDIPEILKIIKSDTRKNTFDQTNKANKPYFFINQKNYEGLTLLYVACLNGHVNMSKILLDNGADHLQKCGGGNEAQSVLDAAVRWGHQKLVEFLLVNCKWPTDYLKSSLKEATELKNEKLTQMLKKAIIRERNESKKNSCSCFCFR
jgi:hypothetical protein